MATTQPIRSKKQLRKLADYFRKKGELRNYALVVVSAHTALRISDTLALTWGDVYDFERGQIRETVTLTERKTNKQKTLTLHKAAVHALLVYLKSLGEVTADGFIFKSRTGKNAHISRVQAYRLIRAASHALHWAQHVSCHSLRKTFGYHAWKSGTSPVLIMEIYNHSSFAVTRRYLGIDQDDKNKVYVSLELFGSDD